MPVQPHPRSGLARRACGGLSSQINPTNKTTHTLRNRGDGDSGTSGAFGLTSQLVALPENVILRPFDGGVEQFDRQNQHSSA